MSDDDIKTLIDILVEQLHIHTDFITIDTRIAELELDDVDVIEVCVSIHDRYQVIVDPKIVDIMAADRQYTVKNLFEEIMRLKLGTLSTKK